MSSCRPMLVIVNECVSVYACVLSVVFVSEKHPPLQLYHGDVQEEDL